MVTGPVSGPSATQKLYYTTWHIPLTLPVIGPTALLRKIGKIVGDWPSAAAVFDPTGAINIGVKVLCHMAPLLGQIQMRNALLVALDDDKIAKTRVPSCRFSTPLGRRRC